MKHNKRSMRIKIAPAQKTVLRRVILLSSSAVVALSVSLILFINITNQRAAMAALPVKGDFRSNGSGDWNKISWQTFNGSAWVQANEFPTSNKNKIVIQNKHTVAITSDLTLDQVVINEGGFVIINSGVTVTINNAKGIDLDVSGTVKNAGVISSPGSEIVFNKGGRYQHNYSSSPGAIPISEWKPGSFCEINGYTTNSLPPFGLQTFSNFVWNCPNQQADINLNTGITSLTGNLIIKNTGSKLLCWANGPITGKISGDLIIAGGNFIYNKSSAASSININGNYNQTGGSFTLSDKDNVVSTINVTGDFNVTGGICNIIQGNESSGIINLSGNMSLAGGQISTTGNQNTSAKFVFRKNGIQYYTAINHSVDGNIDYVVNSGSQFNSGISIVLGRNFTLAPGATFESESPEGITATSISGNVQVTGLRSFDTNADYIFQGTVAQETGDGLPVTVRNLVVNNSSNVKLTNRIAVSGTLSFIDGNLITGDKEVHVINTSANSITGYSSSNYVIGNLKRSVHGSGTYDFPIGTKENYEFVNVNLAGATGVSNITASFHKEIPENTKEDNLKVLSLEKILDCGYWSIIPNADLTDGTFSVSVTARGYSGPKTGSSFALLNRTDASSPWTIPGKRNTISQNINGSSIMAELKEIKSFGQFAIGYCESMQFKSNLKLTGMSGEKNAIYLFPNICTGVDAWVEIVDILGGASLNNIDQRNVGFEEAFQPYINVSPKSTASIKWKIRLKAAGTLRDTTLPGFVLTAVNVGGDKEKREFIQAYRPYNFSTADKTNLFISLSDDWCEAVSSANKGKCIDTASHENMFQANYKNVNSIEYVTGMINKSEKTATMQAVIYLKSFFKPNAHPPGSLAYFEATPDHDNVKFNWKTQEEVDNELFTIERSKDGDKFEPTLKKKGSGKSTSSLYYNAVDQKENEYKYYRLKQTNKEGNSVYSQVAEISM